jgi:hypothetical protein
MANPTTNYGFVLPTPTDLVTDLPADFDVALQGVDTRLKALQPGTTLGDLAYSSATANTNTRLPLGTAGQVLRVNSGATAPEWATPAGGGKVLQVVSAVTTTATTIASTSFTDTTITLAITPTLATSKILVMVSANLFVSRSANYQFVGAKLIRGATDIVTYTSSGFVGFFGGGITNQDQGHTSSIVFLDSPATTSSTTYKVQGQISDTANSGTSVWQRNSNPSTITLMEIGA